MSAVALAFILLVLVSFDSQVREQVQNHFSSPSQVVSDATHAAKTLSGVAMDALRERSLDRAPLLIFVCLAGVLLLFMLRT